MIDAREIGSRFGDTVDTFAEKVWGLGTASDTATHVSHGTQAGLYWLITWLVVGSFAAYWTVAAIFLHREIGQAWARHERGESLVTTDAIWDISVPVTVLLAIFVLRTVIG